MNYTNSKEQRKQIFLKNAKHAHGERYDYSKVEYVRAQDKVEIICKEHGSFWQMPDAHRAGRGCPSCGCKKSKPTSYCKRLTQKQFLEQARAHHGDLYTYEKTKYIGKVHNIIVTCRKHGDFTQKAENHKNGVGCPACGIVKAHTHFIASTEEFIEKSKKVHGNTYTYGKARYTGKEYPIIITCKEHGDFIVNKANWHYLGHQSGCPKCSMAGTSKQEQEVLDFVTSLGFTPLSGTKKIIAPLELDIVIPELNIAIEYCGLYWHSEKMGKDKNYHLNKVEQCEKAGYRLITIFSDEWMNKRAIVESRLKHILGKDTEKRVFARKLEIRKVESKVSREFFNTYHIQGTCGASWIYGLYDKEELVACISFGVNRFTKEAGVELIRYATSINVVGGFSRLLKHFIKSNPEVKAITSYSCRRWSQGNVYSHNGFVLTGISQPSYFYVKPGEEIRYNRVLFQKAKLADKLEIFNPELTEVENMVNNGYYRIFDNGCHRWEIKLA